MRVLMSLVFMGFATGAMAQAPAIPTAFHGDWSTSLKGCSDPQEDVNGLTVGASSLKLYDGTAVIEGVEALGATQIKVQAFWNAEGEAYRKTHELKLSDGGNQLSVTGIGKSGASAFIRCPA